MAGWVLTFTKHRSISVWLSHNSSKILQHPLHQGLRLTVLRLAVQLLVVITSSGKTDFSYNSCHVRV